ncbi:hypothetical protein ACFWXA_22600 [Streptomyces atroolivaceus]|uniref:hypothetical protein n=1 Tax=Streptomyces atroolivaceus TaxID=66869 RepID=UPI0036628085
MKQNSHDHRRRQGTGGRVRRTPKRPERYREELDRKDFLHGFSSLDDYLRELDVQVRFADASPAELARVSQLTLRTNQFNLTTERLQQSEVAERAAAPGSLVLTIRSGDRFGDNGLVGAVLAHREGDELVIDNFLLSCRVFARGIEQACLSAVLGHARDQGLRAVRAGYRPSAKNGKVQDFYPGNGFRPAGGGTDGAPTLYRHDLAEIPAPPEHIRLTLSLGGLHQ